MPSARAPVLALLCVLPLLGCQSSPAPAEPTPAAVEGAPAVSLFVTRWDVQTTADVERILDDAVALGATDVYWQARGQADAAYASTLEPLMDHLGPDGPGFDPLRAAVAGGHYRGLRVHAWINVLPLWRGLEEPGDRAHLYWSQPAWRLRDGEGRPQRLTEGYVLLNPAPTVVHDHLVAVVEQIVSAGVDGIVLDQMWMPEGLASGDRLWPGDALSIELYRAATGRTRPTNASERERYRAWIAERLTLLARRLSAAAGAGTVGVVAWGPPEAARARLVDPAAWVREGTADRVVCFWPAATAADHAEGLEAWRDTLRGGIEGVVVVPAAGTTAPDQLAATLARGDAALFAYASLFDSPDPAQPDDAASRGAPPAPRRPGGGGPPPPPPRGARGRRGRPHPGHAAVSAIGIDIGGSTVKAVRLEGREVAAVGVSEPYARPDIEHLRAAVAQARHRAGAAGPDLPTGACLPGRFDPSLGVITASVNLPALEGVPIGEVLGVAPERVRVVSDAHAAGFDIAQRRGVRARLLAISIGTGVGASVLDDGVLLRVNEAGSGHLGQIDVGVPGPDGRTPTGPDGGVGSLEAYLGLPALRQRFGEDLDARLPTLGPEDPAVQALARAVRIAHAIYRPEQVWLLGGIGMLLGRCPALEPAIREGLTRVARPGWTLGVGWSRHHAASGAALLALEEAG